MKPVHVINAKQAWEESSLGPVTHFLGFSCPEINVREPGAKGQGKEGRLTAAAGGQGWHGTGSRLEFGACPHQQKSSWEQHIV